jgi:homoserine acetyltransferase
VPALWLTAENDSYFPPALSKRMVDAFRAGGGRVTYELLPAVGSDGHELMLAPAAAWASFLERFLTGTR